MSSSEKTKEPAKAKEKRRLLDETGKRLLKEIRPLRGWIFLSAVICLILIGCSVAGPELLGSLINRLYDIAGSESVARDLLPGIFILIGVYAVRAFLTYGKYYLLTNIVSRYFCAGMRIRLSDKMRRLPV